MKAFVQVRLDGDWLNENCYSSANGFLRFGYEIVKFQYKNNSLESYINESIEHPLELYNDESDIIHGGIGAIRTALRFLGYEEPEIHNPHIYLPNYLGRDVSETTFGDILGRFENKSISEPVFIKPLNEHKLFTGKVIRHFSDLISLANIDTNCKILQSEVVDWVSEYRCFVNRGRLIGCKNYTGDFEVLPDFDKVYGAIDDYKDSPISYSIDFGITRDGETQLIEINDGFALGSYGLNPMLYCRFIKDRWDELKTKTKTKKQIKYYGTRKR